MKSALAGYALRVGFAMLVLAACLLAPELVARWLGLDSGWSLRPNRAACQQRSPSLLLDFIPSCTGELNETPVTINAHGFRSGEIREDDSRRILMLGHSSTFGWKVESDETYPAALQRLLDEFQPAPGYQVINAGNPGHTAYQGKVLLSERGLALDPYSAAGPLRGPWSRRASDYSHCAREGLPTNCVDAEVAGLSRPSQQDLT